MVVKCQEMGEPSMKNQKHFRRYPMKLPGMKPVYHIAIFFASRIFCHPEPNPLARETGPRVRTRAPEMSRIFKISKISKIRGRRL